LIQSNKDKEINSEISPVSLQTVTMDGSEIEKKNISLNSVPVKEVHAFKKVNSLKEKTAESIEKKHKKSTENETIVLPNEDKVMVDNDSSILFLCSVIYVLMGLNLKEK
jgi:hypothetical protein